MKRIVIVLMAAIGLGQSQTGSDKPPAFEVVSVKPSANGVQGGIGAAPGGRFSATGITVSALIAFAYETRDEQISGGPKWLATDGYDVVGKAEGQVTTPDQMRQLFQSLLADRFKLVFHYETRELPVYDLTVAKGGSKLRPTKEGSCVAIDFNHPPPPPVRGQPLPILCGSLSRGMGNGKNQKLDAYGIGITKPAGGAQGLTNELSDILGRTVIDKTGLTGIFDIHLEWTPDSVTVAPSGPGEIDTAGPPILAALEEQLGLKVVADKGPVRVLAIDRVERPGEN
jgi:uncharacterized protein (TIGR03435 family)